MRYTLFAFLFCWITQLAAGRQTDVTHLGVVNLTVRNIEKITFLEEQGILLFDSLLVTGYLHSANTTEIEKVKQYLIEQKIDFIRIETIKGEVSLDSLFVPNKWSPQFNEVFTATDGLIFLGGDDIPPAVYGESTFITTSIIDRTRNWELSLMFHLIGGNQNKKITPLLDKKPDFPILGVCLGMQIMNVAAGGSLYQDIPIQIYKKQFCEEVAAMPQAQQHKNYLYGINNNDDKTSYIAFHQISLTAESFLKGPGYKSKICVPSVHHQAVKQTGQHLKTAATSIDGKVVEALQHSQYPNVYGIQFHIDFPELFAPDARFQMKPNHFYQIPKEDQSFYKALWLDFSKRLHHSSHK